MGRVILGGLADGAAGRPPGWRGRMLGACRTARGGRCVLRGLPGDGRWSSQLMTRPHEGHSQRKDMKEYVLSGLWAGRLMLALQQTQARCFFISSLSQVECRDNEKSRLARLRWDIRGRAHVRLTLLRWP